MLTRVRGRRLSSGRLKYSPPAVWPALARKKPGRFGLSGWSSQHVNVTPEEVEKGLVAAGIPQFAARSVRELDEETSRGYHAIVTTTVTNLTGRVPLSVEDFLQATVPALMA